MRIAIPLYDGFTALDAVGPYEVLSRLPGAGVTWLAHEPGVVRTDNTMLGIEADAAFEELPDPEIVMVPGGTGTNAFLDDERLVGWIRRAHEGSQWTTSVCTGSLLLGAAGVLEGLEATSHWLDVEDLERYGARPTGRRVVEQGKVIRPPACPPASTWRWSWPRRSPAPKWRRRSSSGSSTTPSRPSTPAPWTRPRRRRWSSSGGSQRRAPRIRA
jgi:putative intracellular protease/amidase